MSDAVTTASQPDLQKRPSQITREFEWIARLIVGGILVWSGAAHLANPYYFMSTVYQYELTSAPVGALVASFMPFLELVLAACLLSGCCQRAAWALTSLMLLGFVSVQGSALYRGLKISCGCFGPEINRPIDATSISYTATLAVLAIIAWVVAGRLQTAKPAVTTA